MEEPFEHHQFTFMFQAGSVQTISEIVDCPVVMAGLFVGSTNPSCVNGKSALLFCGLQKILAMRPSSWEPSAILGTKGLVNIRSLVYLLSRQLLQKRNIEEFDTFVLI